MEASQIPDGTITVDVVGDPQSTLKKHQETVRQLDSYWAGRQQTLVASVGEEAPETQEIVALRKMLRGLVAPRLEEVSKKTEHLGIYLNLLVPFDSAGGLNDFLLHFFQLEEKNGEVVYQVRDRFERDVYVLYDVYRVKKTREVINALRAARKDDARRFPSIFTEAQIMETLNSLDAVLDLLFSQCLPAQRRKEILPQLTPRFIQGESLLKRRDNNITYAYPHVLDKYNYRRFFFLVYFKDGLRAKVSATEEKEYRYNFLDFQVIKHEFLVHWLSGPLREDPRKYEVYKKYMMHGKTLLQLVVEKPEDEASLLQQMPAHTLNDMASQVNEELPDEMKIGAVPGSENFGLFHKLKKSLESAVEMVRAPIEVLRKKVTEQPEVPWEHATDEPQVEEEPKVEPPRWEIHLLKKTQIQSPFLLDSIATFQAQLNAQKVKMGPKWNGFAKYTADILDKTPEMRTIRRRTPKHEWTLPYNVRYVVPGEETREYLFVLGAEAKAKGRGMGYNAKEQYSFSPYFVFATDTPEDGFGEPVGDRPIAGGKQLKEYDFKVSPVMNKALEIFEVLKGQIGGE